MSDNDNQLLTENVENQEKSVSILEDNKDNKDNNNNNEEQTISLDIKNFEEEEKKVNIIDLNNELEELKKKLKEERIESLTKINELNLKEIEINKKIKNIYKHTINLIQKLKLQNKNVTIDPKFLTRNKNKKTEEEIKNDIKVKEAQIKLYITKANYVKNSFEKNAKNFEEDIKKEKTLEDLVLKFKSEIELKESQIRNLKKIYIIHLNCPKEKKSLIDKYNFIESDYRYELKRAEQLSKIKMKEKDEEDDIIEEEYDKLDDRGKMERDERILLPRLKGLLKFRGEKIQKLEEKIIKLNKIGQFKNEVKGNVTSLYKKIENIYKNNKYNNNNRYFRNSNTNNNIRKIKQINIDGGERYLFSDNDAKIMKKVIPDKMFISFNKKYDDLFKNKIETQKIINKERCQLHNTSEILFNKYLFKMFEIKNVKMDKIQLTVRSQKLREKISNLKRNITEIKFKLKKQEKKLKEKEKETKRINLYFKHLQIDEKKSNIKEVRSDNFSLKNVLT